MKNVLSNQMKYSIFNRKKYVHIHVPLKRQKYQIIRILWGHNSCKNLFFQSAVSCLKWDPTGHILATCADGDENVKLWFPQREGLILLYTLPHKSPVAMLEWCTMLGKGESKQLMLARYICFLYFMLLCHSSYRGRGAVVVVIV